MRHTPQALTDRADPQIVQAIVQEPISAARFDAALRSRAITERAKANERTACPHSPGGILAEAQRAYRIAGRIALLELGVGRFRQPVQPSRGSNPQRV